MKKMTTVIAMAASIMFAASAFSKPPHQGPMTEEQLAEIVALQQAAVDELELLPAAAEQVKEIIAEHAQKRAELRASIDESRQALKEDFQASMGEFLTDDQMSDLKNATRSAMRANFDGERKHRHKKDDTSD